MTALAVLFWFPYIVAIPGVLAASLLWPGGNTQVGVRRRAILAGLTLGSASLLLCVGYLLPLTQLHAFF